MALTFTKRFGLHQWGSGTDPFTRAQMNDAFAAIDAKAATLDDVATVNTATAVDANTLTTKTGVWIVDTLSNGPAGMTTGVVVEVTADTGAVLQAAYTRAVPWVKAYRTQTGSTWSGWVTPDATKLGALTGDLDAGGNRVVNAADPVNDNDLITKGWAVKNMGAWTQPIPLTLAAGVRNSTHPTALPLAYMTNEGGKLVRVRGHVSFNSSTATLATLPAGLYSPGVPFRSDQLAAIAGSTVAAGTPTTPVLLRAPKDGPFDNATVIQTQSYVVTTAGALMSYPNGGNNPPTALDTSYTWYIDFTYRLP